MDDLELDDSTIQLSFELDSKLSFKSIQMHLNASNRKQSIKKNQRKQQNNDFMY